MTTKDVQPVTTTSTPVNDHRLDQLRQLFPEAFSEAGIDFDKLRATLGDIVDDRPDRYTFTWAGKQDAIRLLQTPTAATLVPDYDESVNFQDTRNIFIEGENLEVLKLLYKTYFGRVKMIYIDPPYNTGNDFIYPDDFRDPLRPYLQLTGQMDQQGNLLRSNPEVSGRYHSAWLNLMYPRLFVARQLLCESGAIFVSIADHEVQNLKLLLNEIFGEENFIASVIWQKIFAPKNSAKHFSEDHDYVLVYARNAQTWRPNLLPRSEDTLARYQNPDNDPRGPWASDNFLARNYYSRGSYTVTSPTGIQYSNPTGTYWRVSQEKFHEMEQDNRVWWGEGKSNMPRLKRFLSEVPSGVVPQTIWFYKDVGHTQDAKKELLKRVHFDKTGNVLNTVKPTALIRRMVHLATNPKTQDIVLDFFAGSAATAEAVLTQNQEDGGNRQYIAVQLPEPLPEPESKLKTIADIAKTRIASTSRELQKRIDGTAVDSGVRIFNLAASTLRPWSGTTDPTPDEYTAEMSLFTDPITAGANPRAVLWEVAIKEGYPLSSRIRHAKAGDNTIYHVTDEDTDRTFFICLDDHVPVTLAHTLKLAEDDLLVVRDIALDDTTAANLALQCRLKTI